MLAYSFISMGIYVLEIVFCNYFTYFLPQPVANVVL